MHGAIRRTGGARDGRRAPGSGGRRRSSSRPRARRSPASTSSPDAVEKTAAEIAESGGTARGYTVDVSDPVSVRPAVDAAATDPRAARRSCSTAPASAASRTRPRRRSTSGRRSSASTSRARSSCARPRSRTSSTAAGRSSTSRRTRGSMGQRYSAAYCASKGGVVNLTRALADEYLKRNDPRELRSRRAASRRRSRTSSRRCPKASRGRSSARSMTPLGQLAARGDREHRDLRRVRRMPLHDRLDRVGRRRPHDLTPFG